MANWITHTRIADILLNKNLNLDEKDFVLEILHLIVISKMKIGVLIFLLEKSLIS